MSGLKHIQDKKRQLRTDAKIAREKLLTEVEVSRVGATVSLKKGLLLGAGVFIAISIIKKIFIPSHKPQQIMQSGGSLMATAGSRVKLKIYEQFMYNIALFLLMIARNKLTNYLDEQGKHGRAEHFTESES
ncbi:MAG: hypothetical protein ACFCUU_04790 [Cyclobacteriaceae bacterium]